eukprot:Rmarinus@m.8563
MSTFLPVPLPGSRTLRTTAISTKVQGTLSARLYRAKAWSSTNRSQRCASTFGGAENLATANGNFPKRFLWIVIGFLGLLWSWFRLRTISAPQRNHGFSRFECDKCGFALSPAFGRESKFFPAHFRCPCCGSSREMFRAVDMSRMGLVNRSEEHAMLLKDLEDELAALEEEEKNMSSSNQDDARPNMSM